MSVLRTCPAKLPEIVLCECPERSGCCLQEYRALAQPGGKARAMEEYRESLRTRAAELYEIRQADKEKGK